MSIAIYIFRQDLRLQDNPAFSEALASHSKVLPVYIHSENSYGKWQLGGASRCWLHHSLTSLEASLEKMGQNLYVFEGQTIEVLEYLAQKVKAESIYWNRCYEPDVIGFFKDLKEKLEEKGLNVKSFNSSLLFEPWGIKNKKGKPYQVYTPYWRECLNQGLTKKPLKSINILSPYNPKLKDIGISKLHLRPKTKWDHGFYEAWNIGESAARKKLQRYLKGGVKSYNSKRDIPSVNGTSRLSPHLHFGEISPSTVLDLISRNYGSIEKIKDKEILQYVKEIFWREFSYHLLYYFPTLPTTPLRVKYSKFPWRRSKKDLKSWQQGQTGYPIVDAGMRELWQTGWMHNRVRMIVASFLVKHLLLPWQDGASWFWDTLLDADLASNTQGWQWGAGCGADAAPYFRIFNPILQGVKFDPEGRYVKKWVPELENLDNKWIHCPWEASKEKLEVAGVRLGKTYPNPIVEHAFARDRALAAYKKLGES